MADIHGVLHPYPLDINWEGGYLKITRHINLTVPVDLSHETLELFKSTWNSFTQSKVQLSIISNPVLGSNSFRLSSTEDSRNETSLKSGNQSALSINRDGVCGIGISETALKHSWFSMLQLLVAGRTPEVEFYQLPFLKMQDKPALNFRALHLCIFPETSLEFAEKIIKLAAFMKFSHIVIEFWGMLKYECLSELAWPMAYTKEQVRDLLQLAQQMGVQPIPMFSHWGHAAASRDRIGRHVILDQNPALESLFEPDGWTWCLKNPASLALLKNIRAELMDLFPTTNYFHLGCDEAYSHGSCPECERYGAAQLWAEYLNAVNDDLKLYNVRPLIWGDGLLEKALWKDYIASSSASKRTHEAIDMLSRDFIICDWQYGIIDKTQTATIDYFSQKGFEVITAPYSNPRNISAMADLAFEKNLFGTILTTWHTLPFEMKVLPLAAGLMWNHVGIIDKLDQYADGYLTTMLATYLRKLRGTSTGFKNAGWRSYEVDDKSNQ